MDRRGNWRTGRRVVIREQQRPQIGYPASSSACSSPLQCSLSPANYPIRALESRLPARDSSRDSLVYEELIEKGIYRCRFLTFLGVLGSLVGSFLCFIKGCTYVVDSFAEYFVRSGKSEKVILSLVEAIDIYLLGTVMLVFGMGLYELFISNLDIASNYGKSAGKGSSQPCGSNLFGLFTLLERPKWLEIQSVNELKTKLGHVIVMVLLVGLFEKSRTVVISSTLELLCFSASILLSSGCLYLLSKLTAESK
ncbi:hypothetical protein H6P81_005832 [Aristolochia fimbriata]|uniref:Uncharacterized protein n=1 Tax=Aristolochia fimbriata TaxID=158543 RepID=A0AAV7F059_ARIFI|nr:hypothetical protein H6P81_005832 [Aristolochia fimbriata]